MKKGYLSLLIVIIFTSILLLSNIGVFNTKKSQNLLEAIDTQLLSEQEKGQAIELSPRQKAVEIVKNLNEIEALQQLFNDKESTEIKGNLIIEVDSEKDNLFIVHVYELLNNNTVTYYWYEVNLDTNIATQIEK